MEFHKKNIFRLQSLLVSVAPLHTGRYYKPSDKHKLKYVLSVKGDLITEVVRLYLDLKDLRSSYCAVTRCVCM